MVNLKMILFDIIMVLYVIIAILIFVPPVLLSIGPYNDTILTVSDGIHDLFTNFCHQLPWRSIFLNGIKMPVCARCTAIYLFTALGLIYFRLKGFGEKEFKMNWVLLVLLFTPTALDGLTQMFHLRESTNLLRVIAGTPYGLGYAYIIAWSLPLIYALLGLMVSIIGKKDDDTIDGILKRIKNMVWPVI